MSKLRNICRNTHVSNPKFLNADQLAYIAKTTNLNVYLEDAFIIQLTDPFNDASPNLKPKGGSPALTSAGEFVKRILMDAFFG